MLEASGWAVMGGGGKIFVNTVSATRRAAIINFLVTERQQFVSADRTDEDIENMWAHFGKHVLVREVSITDKP